MTTRTPWLVFTGALIVVVCVMALVTGKLVAQDRQRSEADRQGAHHERVRLALWRLDSQTTALLMQEIAAMPLLGDPRTEQALPDPGPHVHARFVVSGDTGVRIVGDSPGSDHGRLSALVSARPLAPRLPEPAEDDGIARLDNPVQRATNGRVAAPLTTKGSYSLADQRAFNDNELVRRLDAVNRNFAGYGESLSNTLNLRGTQSSTPAPPPRPAGAVRPVWIEDELLLLRRVRTDNGEAIHGVWLNWPVLHEQLLGEVRAQLPRAKLVAVDEQALTTDLENLLATLPIRLVPGAPDGLLERSASLLPSLALGWIGVLAAIIAVFAVLRWSLALAERRAVFVSTVTHELRTPITTFRMYTEMLQEGMVDEAKRGHYLATLRREADRLGELVENVLAYARIESNRAPLTPETLTIDALLSRMRDRLTERAASADLELHIAMGALADASVRVDPVAVEQILFNLVDNAAKYGACEASPRVELTARECGTRIAVCIRDYGPGIAPEERKTIFAPFTKARVDDSGTKPGVGLGLALSKRLAQQLSGELTVESSDPGVRFVLSLPRSR
ncbi:MAG: HAMP domain-containing histidine kinase [Nannocystaceae bacterium]|nr:HAMP domain-containing histidine kinase [Nannocystaceae bacterium]